MPPAGEVAKPSKGNHASQWETSPLTKRPGLSKGDWASHWEVGPLKGRTGLSRIVWASQRDAGHFKGGQASHSKVGTLTGRPGLSQGGWVPNIFIQNLQTILIKSTFDKIFKYQLCVNHNILNIATKQQKKIILLAS